MRLAIVRGDGLTKYEAQNFEPLKQYYDITAFASKVHDSESISKIELPIKYLTQVDAFTKYIRYPYNYAFRFAGISGWLKGLTEELRDFDVVNVVETYHYFCLQAIKAKEKYGCKVVVSQWEVIPFFCEDLFIFKLNMRSKIKQKVRDNADMFIAITEKAKEALILEGVDGSKIRVIPMGIDTEVFKPMHSTIQRDTIHILFVGRIVESKGVFDLLSAYLSLRKEIPNVTLTYIGSGNRSKELQSHIKRLQLGDVYLIDYVPYEYLPYYYNDCDVFVLPSKPHRFWQEQLGFVLLEAMACGKPIITTNCGAISEVVGVDNLVVRSGYINDLYFALKKLCLDRRLREDISRKNRERALKIFNKDIVATKLKEIFKEVEQK